MTKADLFIQQFCYWVDKLGLKQIRCRKDLRYEAAATFDVDGGLCLVVNWRKMASWNYHLIMSGVFHEIGHYKNNLPYNTWKQQVKSEYRAERYALNMLKKYYPESYKYAIWHGKTKNLGDKQWCKREKLHRDAYSLIKEYVT